MGSGFFGRQSYSNLERRGHRYPVGASISAPKQQEGAARVRAAGSGKSGVPGTGGWCCVAAEPAGLPPAGPALRGRGQRCPAPRRRPAGNGGAWGVLMGSPARRGGLGERSAADGAWGSGWLLPMRVRKPDGSVLPLATFSHRLPLLWLCFLT